MATTNDVYPFISRVNSCTERDFLGVYFWDYIEYGLNRGMFCSCSKSDADYANDMLQRLVCWYVSQKDIVDYINGRNCNKFRMRYDKSNCMWYLERLYQGKWYEHDRYSPYDLKYRDYREELCDAALGEEDFKRLLHDCRDIAFCEWSVLSDCRQCACAIGFAYCDKKRFSKMCDKNTKNWRQRALELIEDEADVLFRNEHTLAVVEA
jgi:hypothetical protein